MPYDNTEEEYEGYKLKYNASVGAHTYATTGILIHHSDSTYVMIGRYCSIAQNLQVMVGGNHPLDHVSTYPLEYVFPKTPSLQGVYKGKTIIENDVWIGQNVCIMPGIHIDNGAVVGAFSVVTRDVPAYAIVAGNPAEIKKYRFSEDIRNRLCKLAWWNWPIEKLRESLPLLNSTNIENFLEQYEKE